MFTSWRSNKRTIKHKGTTVGETITISFTYTNHNGKTEVRTMDHEQLHYIDKPGYDYEPGWFISGFCHTKQARRSFALKNIHLPAGYEHRLDYVQALLKGEVKQC